MSFDEFKYKGKSRIVVIKIPAAEGEPTMFVNEPFIRINESKTSLRPYIDWIREIYNSKEDWSKFIIGVPPTFAPKVTIRLKQALSVFR